VRSGNKIAEKALVVFKVSHAWHARKIRIWRKT
jgi:hypothetical protein